MTETFDHLFGGWKQAKARRWRNPDGSEGGIVAEDARLDQSLVVPSDAVIWPGASIGDGDWWLSGGPCGSRNAFWTVTYLETHGLRWWIGCQRGITTERFIERLSDEHGDNKHAADYRAVIAFVEGHPGLARAKSKAEAKAT